MSFCTSYRSELFWKDPFVKLCHVVFHSLMHLFIYFFNQNFKQLSGHAAGDLIQMNLKFHEMSTLFWLFFLFKTCCSSDMREVGSCNRLLLLIHVPGFFVKTRILVMRPLPHDDHLLVPTSLETWSTEGANVNATMQQLVTMYFVKVTT